MTSKTIRTYRLSTFSDNSGSAIERILFFNVYGTSLSKDEQYTCHELSVMRKQYMNYYDFIDPVAIHAHSGIANEYGPVAGIMYQTL